MQLSMKNITLFLLLLILTAKSYAQDGYSYTLAYNGSYSFTIQAAPNPSSNNFATSVQSYGFTIIVPDGVTIDTGNTTSLGGAANATFFDGSAIGQASIDGYLVTETLGSPISLPAPSAATNTDLYTFTVNGNPTSGTLYILENNSALATTVTPLKSFMQADMIDNGMAQFVNVVDPNGAAVSGISSYEFNTLAIEDVENEAFDLSLFPNPAKDVVKILTPENVSDINVSVFDNTGKYIGVNLNLNNSINISHLSTGVYFVKITLNNDTIINKKLIVK